MMGFNYFDHKHRLSIFFLILLAGCKLGEVDFDGLESPVYEAQVSVAMAETSYSVSDLILGIRDSSLTIEEAPNGLLSITYEDSAEFRFEGLDLLILLANPSAQQEVILQQREIFMKFFDEFESGLVTFANPTITFTFENYYGVPLGLLLEDFASNREREGEETTRLSLMGDIIDTPPVIEATPQEDIGENPTRTSITITTDNSNLEDLFSFLPLALNNSLRAVVNPNNENITGNVVGADGRLLIKTKVQIPLQAVVDSLETIVDFNMNEGLSFEEADSVTLRIVTLNSTPLDGHMIMEFYDADSMKIYDVPTSMAFQSATVGPRAKTVDPDIFIDDIPLDSLGIIALANTHYIDAYITMNSFKLESRDIVSFFSSYNMDITVTAVIQIKEPF